MATSGWIEDRWLKKRKDPVTGKRERTDLYGTNTKRYRVCGIPGVRKRSFDTLEEAKQWRIKAIAATQKKEFVDDRDGEILLGDYITDEWWPSREYDLTTGERMKGQIFKHIVGTALGRTPMYVIGDSHLSAWKKELQTRGLAPGTLELLWVYLGSVFKTAVGRRIAQNPCRVAEENIRPKPSGNTKARAWTADEAAALRAAMKPRYRIVADLGMHAGLRQGEAFGFGPDDVDEALMVVHVRRQLQWTRNGKPYFKLPKGKKERDVPLSPSFLALIREHERAFPSAPVALPWVGPGNGGRPNATVQLLATSQWGNRLKPNTFNATVMKPALVAAGFIAPVEGGKQWGWEASREMMHHRWRHTYASVQLSAGEDPVAVSHWLGHASVAITLQVYAHFMPDNGRRGRTAVDSWLESAAPVRPAGRDLRAVEPLEFATVTKLTLPEDATRPVELRLSCARYGGVWAVGAQHGADGPLLGEIRTVASEDPGRALAAGLAWVEEYCDRSGLAVAEAEDLSGEFPAEVRRFQALGRVALVAG